MGVKKWCIYIIRCRGGTLYTGITNDLERRIGEHKRGRGCLYTKYRRPVRLLYTEPSSGRPAATKREAGIKAWSRTQKLQLIRTGRKT